MRYWLWQLRAVYFEKEARGKTLDRKVRKGVDGKSGYRLKGAGQTRSKDKTGRPGAPGSERHGGGKGGIEGGTENVGP